MITDNGILVGKGKTEAYLLPAMANRHGLITGASGTGKTVTLKVLAESFSMLGVPVFLADVKGDLAGMTAPGEPSESIKKRLKNLNIREFTLTDFPSCFWDVYGTGGHKVRTAVSEMGPLLLGRLLGLTRVQQGVLNIAFKLADDQGLLLLDLKDLKAVLRCLGENRARYSLEYGHVTTQSVAAIQRSLLSLEGDEGEGFFGEPALDIRDWMRMDSRGRGYINMLDCRRLFLAPQLYAAFMLFLLSELFEELPEAGDGDKPRMVFFFDEAHLLFSDADKALTGKIEQVAKLIRSKGVGVYFITQSPSDIPDAVLAQLSNRVQHALRAYTPREQKAVWAAADSFRPNPAFSTRERITQLGVGEALVSFLDEKGVPGMVEQVTILPPQSLMGPIGEDRRQALIDAGPGKKYDVPVDRESAYELLAAQFARAEQEKLALERAKEEERARKEAERQREKMLRPLTGAARSMLNTVGRQLGREISRGLFGSPSRRR